MASRPGRGERKYVNIAVVAATFLSLFGCGADSSMAPVRGKVTLEGVPVAGAVVAFLPEGEGRPGIGRTSADGSYEVSTLKPGDGALIGMHRVTVTAIDESGAEVVENDEFASLGEIGGKPQTNKWLAPQRYANADTSGLRFEVQAGQQNTADFDLKE